MKTIPSAQPAEPFDSYWLGTEIELTRAFKRFGRFFRTHFTPHLPPEKSAKILVVSCGPGFLLQLLKDDGYTDFLGIDSDPQKVNCCEQRGLPARTARAFETVSDSPATYDMIVCQQELNHLSREEVFQWLSLCYQALKPGGRLLCYGLNGSNPLLGSGNLSQNVDHFFNLSEYRLQQLLEHSGFEGIRVLHCSPYVFWENPLNYVGLAATTTLELFFRLCYKLYGKNIKILSKQIIGVCRKPTA